MHRRADRRKGRDRAVDFRVTQGECQCAVAAHRVAEDADAIGIGGELLHDDVAQFLRDITFHAVVLRPRGLRRIQVKPGACAEVPGVGFAGNAGLARAGVHRYQHQTKLGGVALRTGFDHEGFFGAGESGEEKNDRNALLLRLRRLIHRETHRQADDRGRMPVIALDAVEAAVLAADLKCRHGQ